MTRIVLLAAVVLAVWIIGLCLWRWLARRQMDWKGIAFAVGFVALAFWLRHATGMT